jgi:hypothetical protein
MAGGFGNGPWGNTPWGGGFIEEETPEHLPTTPAWNIFDLGGVSLSDINRLSDFVEVSIIGASGSHFLSSWNIASGGAYPTDIAYVLFDVAVPETFTIEYRVKFNSLPEDFADPELRHVYLGAWSSQDFASGFLFSKSGVAYTGEVAISFGGGITYAQSIDVIPGSADWFPEVFGEGEEVVVKVVVDSSIPALYFFITKASELVGDNHVLRAILDPKVTVPGTTVDTVVVSVRGTLADESWLELVNNYRMSSQAYILNLPPIAAAGDDQAVRMCSIVQLDGTSSYDPEGAELTYEWRLIDAPLSSLFIFSGGDGRTEPEVVPSGFSKVFYSNSLGEEHIQEPILVNDVLVVAGVGHTIKVVNNVSPFNVEVEYTQLPDNLVNTKFKVLRNAALKDADEAKPTFYPDVVGFWTFDLRVYDGSLWSSPLGLERSRVLVDVRESPLPRGCPVDTSFVFDSLLDFWKLVEDRDRISTLWDAVAQVTSTELLTLWQSEYSKSLRDIQRQALRRWLHYDLMIPEPVPEMTEIKFLWGGALSKRFVSTVASGTSVTVMAPMLSDPVEISLSSPGSIEAAQVARELQTRLKEQVSSAFTVKAITSDVLWGGDHGRIIATGNPLTDVVFTTDPTVNLFGIGVTAGDKIIIMSGPAVGTYTVTGFQGVTQATVDIPFVGGAQSGVIFRIERTGVTFQQVRIDAPFYFTLTSDSTSPLFTYPCVNNVPTGLSGLRISDRVFKVDRPLTDLGIVEDDLIVIGDVAYRVVSILSVDQDEFEDQRVVVKETLPALAGYQEWILPGWVSSEFLNFYNGLFFRGDIVEFEAAEETEDKLQTSQVRGLVTTTAFAANESSIGRLAIDTASLYRDMPVDGVLRLARLVRRRYLPVDDLVVDVPTLQELIVVEDDERTLRRNVDYFIERFRGYNAIRFQSGASQDDGDVWEGARPPDRLWAEYTYINNEPIIEANFGIPIGVERDQVPSTVDYLSAVRGLWYALHNGPTVRNVRIANQILLGLPFAESAGTIAEIRSEFLSRRSRILIRDETDPGIVRSYTYPKVLELEVNPSTGSAYKLGDAVAEFAPLVQGVEVIDYINTPNWFEGILNQGAFYEVQKYHTFAVRVSTEVFDLDALLESQRFTKKIKPVYTDVKSIVTHVVSGDGDEIDVVDDIEYRVSLNLQDAICRQRLGAAYMFDEPWAGGSAYDPPGNTDPYLANGYRNRFDADDDPATPLPVYPGPPDANVLWAFDAAGYLCPSDVLRAVTCQTFAAPTPMLFDSIWSFDIGHSVKTLIAVAAPVVVSESNYLFPQEIAQLLTAPTDLVRLIGLGDSLLAARVPYFCQSCYEVPWVGAIQYGASIRYDNAGVQNVELSTVGAPLAAAVSPLIGGDVTWFPLGDHEVEFLGGLILGTSISARISAHVHAAVDFPLMWANLVGMPARARTIAYRHAAAPTTEPGVLMVARSTADASYPVVAPNYQSPVTYDFTGSGYVSLDAAIPDTFNWAGSATVNAELIAVPSADTTNNEIVAYHQPWIEGNGPGVVFLEWSVGGVTGARYASNVLFPPSLFEPGGFFQTFADTGQPVLYWALGANSPNEAVAIQEIWIETVIGLFRSAFPNAPVILTTTHFGNNAPSYDLNMLTATRNVAARTLGCLLLDTYLYWGNWRRGNAAGYYGDVIHLGAAGELVKCAMIGDMLHDVASGIMASRIDFRLLTPGVGPEVLPGGIVVTTGVAANRSVWTGTALVTDVTANRARIGRLAIDDPPALLIEPEATNDHTFWRGVPTIAGLIRAGNSETSCAASGIAGPDGTGDATRYQIASGGWCRNYYDAAAGALEYTASAFVRHATGTGNDTISSTETKSSAAALTTAWVRISSSTTGSSNGYHLPVDGRERAAFGGAAAGARDVLVDFQQMELGAIATSPIPSGATRTAEAMAFPDALSTYLVGGRLKIALRLRPLAARASYKTTVAQYFWYVDADNYLLFQPASGALLLRVGGTNDGPVATISWTADDVLEIYCECGGAAAGTIVWRTNNGALTSWTGTLGLTLDDGTLYIMGGDGHATCSYVETIDIGGRPRWTVPN